MMKKLVLFLFLICCFISLFSQSTVIGNIVHGGITRTYRLYVPASYNATVPASLVLNLHGYGSSAIEQEVYSFFYPVADTANFLVLHPNGTVDGFGNQFWNTFGLSTVDDVGFLFALIDTVKNNYNIDNNCVYSTGMSNGGFMSYKLACEPGNNIAAVASVTGSMTWNELNACNPGHPTPVMQIHGTADAVVPYNGSLFFVPVDTLISYWVQFNNCNTSPVFTAIPDIDPTDGCTAEHYLFGGGTNNTAVEFYKIIGGAHTWPGAPVTLDVTNRDINASAEIWKFFRKYKLNIVTDIITRAQDKVSIYPNPSYGDLIVRFPDNKIRTISITDISGKIILEKYCMGNDLTFNLRSSGIYFLSIRTGIDITYHKILIIN